MGYYKNLYSEIIAINLIIIQTHGISSHYIIEVKKHVNTSYKYHLNLGHATLSFKNFREKVKEIIEVLCGWENPQIKLTYLEITLRKGLKKFEKEAREEET